MTKRLPLAAAVLAMIPWARSSNAQAPSYRESAPVLVELFTSEGCSSCPPADRILQQLNGTHSRAGARIIALSEHVTYWDHLGWRDRFSDETVTARQSAYGDRFHLDSIYTPQAVINGRVQVVGSDATGIQRAIDAQPLATSTQLRIGEVHREGHGLAIQLQMTGVAQSKAVLYVVVAQDMASTPVQRGENSGQTLTHVSIARSLSRIGPLTAPSTTIQLTDAELHSTDGQKRHLVVFLQDPGTGPILAADSVAL